LVSYRAAEEWHQRFDRSRISKDRRTGAPFELEFEVESYLDYNAKKFIHNFDANSYLYLSRAMDWFDVADHGGSVNSGLTKIHVKTALIIGVTTDILFPPEQQREIVRGLEKAGSCEECVEYVEIDSISGHDAFLVDSERFSSAMKCFLDKTCS
jgi:homoserine O-acetyltransferase